MRVGLAAVLARSPGVVGARTRRKRVHYPSSLSLGFLVGIRQRLAPTHCARLCTCRDTHRAGSKPAVTAADVTVISAARPGFPRPATAFSPLPTAGILNRLFTLIAKSWRATGQAQTTASRTLSLSSPAPPEPGPWGRAGADHSLRTWAAGAPMSAATKRNALAGLDSLDAEARSAVRKAARHAGMSLEEWLAAVSGEASGPPRPPARAAKRSAPIARPTSSMRRSRSSRPSPSSRASPPAIAAEELEDLLARASEDSGTPHPRAGGEDRGRARFGRKLDRAGGGPPERRFPQRRRAPGAHRRDARPGARHDDAPARRHRDASSPTGRQPSLDAALKAVERIEAQLAKTRRRTRPGADAAIQATLRGFEIAIAELAERIAIGRPRRPGAGAPGRAPGRRATRRRRDSRPPGGARRRILEPAALPRRAARTRAPSPRPARMRTCCSRCAATSPASRASSRP